MIKKQSAEGAVSKKIDWYVDGQNASVSRDYPEMLHDSEVVYSGRAKAVGVD